MFPGHCTGPSFLLNASLQQKEKRTTNGLRQTHKRPHLVLRGAGIAIIQVLTGDLARPGLDSSEHGQLVSSPGLAMKPE